MKIYKNVSRPTETPNHHLFLRGNSWVIQWRIRCRDKVLRMTKSIGPCTISIARIRRDRFLGWS